MASLGRSIMCLPVAASPYQLSASLCIRQEIDRFESVHPSIYAVYDLIEALHDHIVAQQLREHVVCIEGADTESTLPNVEVVRQG
ncbi:hypothetical protein BIW11_05328 [Tropilaelaps mercedesae]|uniref:Centaurin-gamma-1A-like n=1 Tax=Tropilaelaps mercedesae TaxID=418985 RepID=A0A1V9Y2S8_9ACAR|nr:hypothetical protein BIW11_05328 [Tropilaelaps mercedesae]